MGDLQAERLREGAAGRTCEAKALVGNRWSHSAVFISFIYFRDESSRGKKTLLDTSCNLLRKKLF